VKGIAADIVVKGVSPSKVAAYADLLMPDKGGIGEYRTFVHVDVRHEKSRWRGN
ncbi:MAG: peptidase M15, partial [Peptococcaceae bacterium]|nr:peptidase M15 [Peptococcaceae bacterium]